MVSVSHYRLAFRTVIGSLAALFLVPVGGAWGQAAENATPAEESSTTAHVILVPPAEEGGEPLTLNAEVRVLGDGTVQSDLSQGSIQLVPPQPSYWLGVRCAIVPDALRAHIELSADGGLLVEQLVPLSPAAEAGIQLHDILVSANQQPLHEVSDLLDAISDSQGEVLSILLVRAGQPLTVDVAPALRPTDTIGSVADLATDHASLPPEAHHLLELLREDELGTHSLRFIHPGVVCTEEALLEMAADLPEGLTIRTIYGQDGSVQSLEVTRDEETWEVTLDNLDDLPEELRIPAESLLRNEGGEAIIVQSLLGNPGALHALPGSGTSLEGEGSLLERLDSIQRELQELRDMITDEQSQAVPGGSAMEGRVRVIQLEVQQETIEQHENRQE